MQNFRFWLFGTLIAFSGSVNAQGFSSEARHEAGRMPTPAYCTDSFLAQMQYEEIHSSSEWVAILDRVDQNNDFEITMEEASQSQLMIELFSQIDENRDGILQKEEILRFTARMILGEYSDMFIRGDLNKNGYIERNELRSFAGLSAENFDEVDLDGDGKISFHEFMLWRESVDGVMLRSAFARLDMNN